VARLSNCQLPDAMIEESESAVLGSGPPSSRQSQPQAAGPQPPGGVPERPPSSSGLSTMASRRVSMSMPGVPVLPSGLPPTALPTGVAGAAASSLRAAAASWSGNGEVNGLRHSSSGTYPTANGHLLPEGEAQPLSHGVMSNSQLYATAGQGRISIQGRHNTHDFIGEFVDEGDTGGGRGYLNSLDPSPWADLAGGYGEELPLPDDEQDPDEVYTQQLLNRNMDDVDKLQRSEMMLTMYINRCNASWAEQQSWAPPNIWDTAEQETWSATGRARPYRELAQSLLQKGKLAFWLLVGEDHVTSQGDKQGGALDVWTADPYSLISRMRPGMLHNKDCTRGYSWQTRVLGQLALAVQGQGGKDALEAIHLILHMNDEQQEDVTRQLWDHKFYGFKRENIVLISQAKRFGYKFNPDGQKFIGDITSPPETSGSGFASMQLNWCPDAFMLRADGVAQPINGTTMELLADKGINWMVSYRARDLCLLNRNTLLDLNFLAQALYLHERNRHVVSTQVILSEQLSLARNLDSMVMSNGDGNVEMRMVELGTPRMIEAVNTARASFSNRFASGLHRYIFHVPTLKQLLASQHDFRPKLRLREGLVYVHLDVADVSSIRGAHAAAIEVRTRPLLATMPEDLDQLLGLVQEQDQDAHLMKHLDTLRPPVMRNMRVPQQPKGPRQGNTTVVFVDDSVVGLVAVKMALALARPGKDAVHVVTFVAEPIQQEYGAELLGRLMEKISARPAVEIRTDVMVRGAGSLLDTMQQYLSSWGADLLVLASHKLAMANANTLIGSVAIAVLKRMQVPVLLVTPNAMKAVDQLIDRRQLRTMCMVEPWGMELLHYLCTRLHVRNRGDRLLLGQVYSTRTLTRQQLVSVKRVMSDFSLAAEGHHVDSVQQVVMDGVFEEVVKAEADEQQVHVVAVQMHPHAKTVPKHVVNLIRKCRGGLLFVKQAPAPARPVIRPS